MKFINVLTLSLNFFAAFALGRCHGINSFCSIYFIYLRRRYLLIISPFPTLYTRIRLETMTNNERKGETIVSFSSAKKVALKCVGSVTSRHAFISDNTISWYPVSDPSCEESLSRHYCCLEPRVGQLSVDSW